MNLSHLIFSVASATLFLWVLNGSQSASLVPSAEANTTNAPIFVRPHKAMTLSRNHGQSHTRASCQISGPQVTLSVEAPGIVWLPTPRGPEDTLAVTCSASEGPFDPALLGYTDFEPVNLTLRRKIRRMPLQTSLAGILTYWHQVRSLRPDPETDTFAYTHVLPVTLRPMQDSTLR